tara:strand:+ start:1048 stop:1827 length:780 start_codon:yes stop_codon:yes gene_type:complete
MKTLNLGGTSPNKLHVVSDCWYSWPEQLARHLGCELNYKCLQKEFCFDEFEFDITEQEKELFVDSRKNPSPLLWLHTLTTLDIGKDDIVIGLVPSCERITDFISEEEEQSFFWDNEVLCNKINWLDQKWYQWKHLTAIDAGLNDRHIAFQSTLILQQLKLFTKLYPNSLFFMFQDHLNNHSLVGVKEYTTEELDKIDNIVCYLDYDKKERWSPMFEWVRTANNISPVDFEQHLTQNNGTGYLDNESELWINAIKSHIVR